MVRRKNVKLKKQLSHNTVIAAVQHNCYITAPSNQAESLTWRVVFFFSKNKPVSQRHSQECFCHYSGLINDSNSAIWPTSGEQMLAVLLDRNLFAVVYRFNITVYKVKQKP